MSNAPGMRNLRQWVCWRREARGRDGEPTKIPYSPPTGGRASCGDAATWGTLAEARKAARGAGHDGIGFVFTASDPFCGVDLDGCVDPETGKVEPWAIEIAEELDSYTEISPSGAGLHVIVRAGLPEGRRRVGRVELYDRDRFFTVTGRRLSGTPHLVERRQEQIDALHARLFPESNTAPPTDRPATPNGLDDAKVLRRAANAANGERFARLWSGDRTGYASASEADLALCGMLALWTGPDEARIASLVARSGLARDKWNRQDYRHRTIARALEGAALFEPGKESESPTHARQSSDTAPIIPESPLRRDSPQAPAFPVEAMPTACRSLIAEVESALGCAPELVALPMLAVLSSAIGTSRIVEVKGGWREWAALFVAVVGSPGAMKTPAAKVAKSPAFARQRDLGGAYSEEKEEWKRELREWEVEKRDAQKAGEPAPEEPQAPTMSRSVASDTTVEALVSILEENPRGLLVHKGRCRRRIWVAWPDSSGITRTTLCGCLRARGTLTSVRSARSSTVRSGGATVPARNATHEAVHAHTTRSAREA